MKTVTILKSHLSHIGGLEKVSRHLAEAFCRKSCHVRILTTGPIANEDKGKAYEVLSIAPRSRWSLCNLHNFDRLCQAWLKDNPSDIIFGLDRNSHQTHYRAGNGVHAAYLKSRQHTDSYLKQASFLINPLHRLILSKEKSCFEDPQLRQLFCNSNMVKNEVLQRYSTEEKKISVIHNGVKWEQWKSPFQEWEEKRSLLLQNHGLSSVAYQLLFVGQGFRRKGLTPLLRAIAEHPCREFQLSVVGKDKETEYFKSLCRQLRISNRVYFFGAQESVIPFYQYADALAIPSYYDPFANVTVEALAMGLYVISSKSNGGHEVLNKKTGHVIENLNQIEDMLSALSKCLEHVKTQKSAEEIRNLSSTFDSSKNLDKMVEITLST
jgi:UDP-glucose:(heptosyl)LPS alpha-1,3-glucosyltransferase